MRAVERHADKAVVFERLEQVADVCGAVRVGTAGDFVMELLRCLGEKLAVARFRDEDVNVLVLEGGSACEQVLVPKSEDSRSKVVGHAQADAEAPHPEGSERREQFCLQGGRFHGQKIGNGTSVNEKF